MTQEQSDMHNHLKSKGFEHDGDTTPGNHEYTKDSKVITTTPGGKFAISNNSNGYKQGKGLDALKKHVK
jgi:hypothetical protein